MKDSGKKHDVFLSQSSKDHELVQAILATLEQNGISCWIAPRDVQSAKPFAGDIVTAIQNSHCFVLVLSPNADASGVVHDEVEQAKRNNIPIIVFKIKKFKPSKPISFNTDRIHQLKAFTYPFEKHLKKLTVEVKRHLQEPSPPPPPLPNFVSPLWFILIWFCSLNVSIVTAILFTWPLIGLQPHRILTLIAPIALFIFSTPKLYSAYKHKLYTRLIRLKTGSRKIGFSALLLIAVVLLGTQAYYSHRLVLQEHYIDLIHNYYESGGEPTPLYDAFKLLPWREEAQILILQEGNLKRLDESGTAPFYAFYRTFTDSKVTLQELQKLVQQGFRRRAITDEVSRDPIVWYANILPNVDEDDDEKTYVDAIRLLENLPGEEPELMTLYYRYNLERRFRLNAIRVRDVVSLEMWTQKVDSIRARFKPEIKFALSNPNLRFHVVQELHGLLADIALLEAWVAKEIEHSDSMLDAAVEDYVFNLKQIMVYRDENIRRNTKWHRAPNKLNIYQYYRYLQDPASNNRLGMKEVKGDIDLCSKCFAEFKSKIYNHNRFKEFKDTLRLWDHGTYIALEQHQVDALLSKGWRITP